MKQCANLVYFLTSNVFICLSVCKFHRMRYRCWWKTVEIEVSGGQLHSEWECCFMRLKGASWRKRYLNAVCIISNTQNNKCKRFIQKRCIHHHEVDHRVRSINREEAPKVGACVRSPYFSDVIATNLSSKNRSGQWGTMGTGLEPYLMTAFNFHPKKTKQNSRHLLIPKMNMRLREWKKSMQLLKQDKETNRGSKHENDVAGTHDVSTHACRNVQPFLYECWASHVRTTLWSEHSETNRHL